MIGLAPKASYHVATEMVPESQNKTLHDNAVIKLHTKPFRLNILKNGSNC